MPGRNYTKPFSIAGMVLGEIYMLYTILAPYHKGPPGKMLLPLPPEDPLPADLTMPPSVLAFKLVYFGFVFGVFGALVGLGIGLLVTGLAQKIRPPKP